MKIGFFDGKTQFKKWKREFSLDMSMQSDRFFPLGNHLSRPTIFTTLPCTHAPRHTPLAERRGWQAPSLS